MNKDISVKKKQKRIFRFNETKWILFASLLENGYSVDDCLLIMNEKINIKKYMEEGKKLEELILQGQNGVFYDHLSFFIQFMSLSKSIYSAFQIQKFEKESIKMIQKKCTYPIFILCISFISIYLFTNYIIPQLMYSFDQFCENIFIKLVYFIDNVCKFIVILLLILIILYFLSKYSNKFHYYLYKHCLFYVPFYKSYLSYFLSGYMHELNAQGLSSLHSFQYLSKLKQNRSLSYLVKNINRGLYEGNELYQLIVQSKYLDKDFKMYFVIGYRNSNLNDSLSSFQRSCEIKWDKWISIISTIVSIVSYGFVGVLLICVYQIMLIPLDLLNQM